MERRVKLVIEASYLVCGENSRDGITYVPLSTHVSNCSILQQNERLKLDCDDLNGREGGLEEGGAQSTATSLS